MEARKKRLVLNKLPKEIAEEVRLARRVEENIEELKKEILSIDKVDESSDWNYNEEDYRTKMAPIRLADELPAGKKPRRINDLKSSGARKVHERNMKNAAKFLEMAVAPDNGEKDRPLFCGGFLFIDQLKPNPANNPGGGKDESNYARHFRQMRVVLQVAKSTAGSAITTVLDEMRDSGHDWQFASEFALYDPDELDKLHGMFVTESTEDTMRILYGIPKKQTKKRPTKQQIQQANNEITGEDEEEKQDNIKDNGKRDLSRKVHCQGATTETSTEKKHQDALQGKGNPDSSQTVPVKEGTGGGG
jgi:hypothetical protein